MAVTIITGGAGGLGTAIRARLRADGRTLVALDARAAQGDEHVVLDVADEGSVAAAIEGIIAKHGAVDGLVCAAGVVAEHPVTEMPLADWRRVIDASLTGTFLAARAVLPAMIAAGRGSIVGFSSGYGTSGYRNGSNYAAAKAGVEALIKSIALEAAPHGIRANAIAPGPINTPMVTPQRIPIVTPLIPMRRIGEPDDVTGLVRFLLSEESAYITGQTIHINGGLLMP